MSTRPPAKLQILLVEDSIEEVFLMRAILEKGGNYQVTTSQDGEQAARLLKERTFDLVVTDLNLPGMDGYDLIRLITTRLPRVPVLATTGYTAAHFIDHAYREGATHVLTKPLDRNELLAKVAELTGWAEPEATNARAVLVIGGLAGDAEWGCAGFILGSRQRGEDVLMLPLRDGAASPETMRRGAERLGSRVILPEAPTADTNPADAHQMLVERIARELKPHVALIPSLADANSDRRETHRISRSVLNRVPTVLTYETATSTHEFHPTLFVDMSSYLDKKLDALSGYLARGRPELDPNYIGAAARYWGKHVQFGLAEAFEVLREGGTDAAS